MHKGLPNTTLHSATTSHSSKGGIFSTPSRHHEDPDFDAALDALDDDDHSLPAWSIAEVRARTTATPPKPMACRLCGEALGHSPAVQFACLCTLVPAAVHEHCALLRCTCCGLANSLNRKRKAREALHVVVIGGGPAGLAAARCLAIGGACVTVVEGRDRLGGRVHTETLRDGTPVDLGASFIHGCSAYNPVYRMARALGARVDRRNGGYSRAWDEESAWPADAAGAVSRAFEALRRVRRRVDDHAARLRCGARADERARALDPGASASEERAFYVTVPASARAGDWLRVCDLAVRPLPRLDPGLRRARGRGGRGRAAPRGMSASGALGCGHAGAARLRRHPRPAGRS